MKNIRKWMIPIVTCFLFGLIIISAGESVYAAQKKGLKNEDGYIYYYDDSGKKVTGWKTVDGNKYYFLSNGRAATGFKKIGSYYYFFSPSGRMLVNSLKNNNGSIYYFGSNGRAVTGWKTVGDYKYYFLSNGKAATGVKTIGGYTYVFTDSGRMRTGFAKVDVNGTAKYYYLSPTTGRSLSGIRTVSTYKMYFNGDGTIVQDKLKKVGDYYYYFSSAGKMLTNSSKSINGYLYYFDGNGRAVTGWKTVGDYKYYFLSTGKAATGVKTIGSYTYVFADNGRMRTGYAKVVVNNVTKYYYLSPTTGRSLSGIRTVSTYKMYFNGDGTIVQDKLKKVGDYYYYFSSAGKMLTNSSKTINGYLYYFDGNGRAVTGWMTIGDYKYYFLSSGKAATGVKAIGKYTYYFADNGRMQTGYKKPVVDGETMYYYFSPDTGRSLTGIYPVSDYEFYFNGDGTIKKGEFFTADNKLLFALASGKICKDNWRNIKYDLDIPDQLYIHCDSNTGEVAQGLTTFVRTKTDDVKGEYEVECTYYLDKDSVRGFRTGFVQDEDGNTYYVDSKRDVGFMVTGYYTDVDNRKVYYFNTETGILQTSGTVDIPDTTISIPVQNDGVLDIDSVTAVEEGDSDQTKLIKYALTQLYKPEGHPKYTSELMIDLDQVPSYNCSGFVMRMYKEVNGVDVFNKDNDLILYSDLRSSTTAAKAGDIVFFNMDNCKEVEKDDEEYRIIDEDLDGVCDRIHTDITCGSNTAHVHHFAIYLGNGQIIHAAAQRGVVLQSLATMTNTENFYLFGYGTIKQELLDNITNDGCAVDDFLPNDGSSDPETDIPDEEEPVVADDSESELNVTEITEAATNAIETTETETTETETTETETTETEIIETEITESVNE